VEPGEAAMVVVAQTTEGLAKGSHLREQTAQVIQVEQKGTKDSERLGVTGREYYGSDRRKTDLN
jgi:hypothetical protein